MSPRWPDGPVARRWLRSKRTVRRQRHVRQSSPRRRCHRGRDEHPSLVLAQRRAGRCVERSADPLCRQRTNALRAHGAATHLMFRHHGLACPGLVTDVGYVAGSGNSAHRAMNRARVYRRLQLLRGLEHEQIKSIFPQRLGNGQYDWFLNKRRNTPRSGRRCVRSRRKIGCTAETLRSWVRRVETEQGQRAGMTTDDRGRLKALERENKELRRANEILKTASAFFAQAELDRKLK